jgi:hypothetical protein
MNFNYDLKKKMDPQRIIQIRKYLKKKTHLNIYSNDYRFE